jgi:hypothetical protein
MTVEDAVLKIIGGAFVLALIGLVASVWVAWRDRK